MPLSTSPLRSLFRNTFFACAAIATVALGGAAVSGCAAELDDEDEEGVEQLWDEGSLDDEPEDLGEVSSAATARPRFQLPFPCNQVWSGQTRTRHSPKASIDFNRPNDHGDPVVASAAGTVSVVQNLGNRSYGRWIEINHGGGWRTRYAHLSTQAVSRGQRVKRGQRIGRVGSTGGSSGPHLHYEQRRDGVAVRVVFNGNQAHYYGTRSYRSRNCN